MPSRRKCLDVVIDEEGLRDRRRVLHWVVSIRMQSVRLPAATVGKLVKHHDQILAHGAADAAVHHFDQSPPRSASSCSWP